MRALARVSDQPPTPPRSPATGYTTTARHPPEKLRYPPRQPTSDRPRPPPIHGLRIARSCRSLASLCTGHERRYLSCLPGLGPGETRSQPPILSNASNSRCSAAVSGGCASMSASRPSGTYCDQHTGSAAPLGWSSTRQSMFSSSGGLITGGVGGSRQLVSNTCSTLLLAVRLSKFRRAVGGGRQLGLSAHVAVGGSVGPRNRLRCDGAQPDDCGL